jgi:hypothetical protein
VKGAAGSTASRPTPRWYWRRTTAPATGGGPATTSTLMAVLVTRALRATQAARRARAVARARWARWARSRSGRPLARLLWLDAGAGTQAVRRVLGRQRGPGGIGLGPIWVQAAAASVAARRPGSPCRRRPMRVPASDPLLMFVVRVFGGRGRRPLLRYRGVPAPLCRDHLGPFSA